MPEPRLKRVLIYAMNYAPEVIGCGRYTGEIGQYLVDQGIEVEVVTTPPHYPGWQARDGYSARKYKVERQDNVRITRCPLALHKEMRGWRRAWAPISFAISSAPVVFWRILRFRPETVYCVEPTLFAAPAALIAAKLVGAKTVLHVQDLEMDAAFAVGHLKAQWLKHLALIFERATVSAFKGVVTISNKMADKLNEKGVSPAKLSIVRNWVDVRKIYPLSGPNPFRAELGISDSKFVALYAGNIGVKQALHLVIDAAESLKDRKDIAFVIAGDGPVKHNLVSRGLPNVIFLPLQPENRLNALLNLADVHLLPQEKDAADLVLPSKIGGMLASGKQIIAMADIDSEIFNFLKEFASFTAPGDFKELESAILKLCDNRLAPTKGCSRLLRALDTKDQLVSRLK